MGRTTGSGQGSIFKTNNGWRGQIMLGGKRRSVSGKKKSEVVDKLDKLKSEYNSGNYAKQSNMTLEEWYDKWLALHASKTLSEDSLSYVRWMFSKYISEEMKSMRVQDLDRRTLDTFYVETFSGFSRNTVQLFSVEFKRCLEAAVDEGIIANNPHHKLQLPKTKPPKKVFAYTAADQKKIVNYCKRRLNADKKGSYYSLYYFLIGTGMRFGEATALTWDDVNLETGMINIRRTASRSNGGTYIKDGTKTEAGKRIIYAGQNIIDLLKQLREHSVNSLVFTNCYGRMLNRTPSLMYWHDLCDELNIPRHGLHSLRHTWATRALEAGVDIKTVSSILGHKNVVTTMNIYQDVFDDLKIQAACTLDALLD